MAQEIVKSTKSLIAEANKIVETISIEEAKKIVSSEKHILIDLRDIRELKREGKIPGAFSCPRGMLEFWIDPESPYHKEIFNQDKTYVFYCASAWRSALSAKTAMDMGLKPVLHIEGGFMAWKKADGDVETLD
ncbi:rhodanese-like domain-containing protein [Paracoccaceae bacterium]|jgi:rhodanese-related sulfurtransferase|nr:rhodanese-like domain-containing protein [Paracoccaceae bacterium]MDA9122526.1 rhodanese-like domain-containing protein [Paracoccaceae bacterium]MDA9228573.1 rhodanese-like domain-containing protein [Paracoccaceae bacterium]MDB4230084.1 rhodanese-like domain-containing protein [Paracoccaceae bacterium]MDC1254685.1 rhodanese-like domain-containing protein [Paracoccaceae bacterium]|tara:strand:- start:459 stop:857 length:399 start_codon:yes stop_codon:yes gene_type:complete